MSSAPKGLGRHQAGQKSRVFQGGFYQDLHKMLDVSSGGEVSSRHPATYLSPSLSPCRAALTTAAGGPPATAEQSTAHAHPTAVMDACTDSGC